MRKFTRALILTFVVLLGVGNHNTFAESSQKNDIDNDKSNQVTKNLKFRDEFGLEKDLNKLQLDKIVEKYGVQLTLEEERELNERFAFQEKSIPYIKDVLSRKYNEDYTLFIDQKNGGTINIGVKSDSLDMNEVKSFFSDKNSDKVKINTIKYSEKDLNKIHDSVLHSRDLLKSKGIIIKDVRTDVINQKVIVGVSNHKKENQQEIQKEFGEVVVSQEAEIANDTNRAWTWNPIQGGVKIRYGDYKCSVGFMATDGLVNYVVTAGHCNSSINDDYYQGATYLGKMQHKNNSNNSDIGAISQSSSLTYTGGKIYSSDNYSDKYDRAQNASQDVVGELVCMSGASTDTNPVQCGYLESNNAAIDFSGSVYTKLRVATYRSVGGDSGGTVYGGTTLKGVNKGHLGTKGVYSHIEYGLRDLSKVSGRTFNLIF
ncbi:S1 family peptidase [Paenibacillus elgii]